MRNYSIAAYSTNVDLDHRYLRTRIIAANSLAEAVKIFRTIYPHSAIFHAEAI